MIVWHSQYFVKGMPGFCKDCICQLDANMKCIDSCAKHLCLNLVGRWLFSFPDRLRKPIHFAWRFAGRKPPLPCSQGRARWALWKWMRSSARKSRRTIFGRTYAQLLQSHDCSLMLQHECKCIRPSMLRCATMFRVWWSCMRRNRCHWKGITACTLYKSCCGPVALSERSYHSHFSTTCSRVTLSTRKWLVLLVSPWAILVAVAVLPHRLNPIHGIERVSDRSVPEELQAVVSWLRPFASIVCHLPALAVSCCFRAVGIS